MEPYRIPILRVCINKFISFNTQERDNFFNIFYDFSVSTYMILSSYFFNEFTATTEESLTLTDIAAIVKHGFMDVNTRIKTKFSNVKQKRPSVFLSDVILNKIKRLFSFAKKLKLSKTGTKN